MNGELVQKEQDRQLLTAIFTKMSEVVAGRSTSTNGVEMPETLIDEPEDGTPEEQPTPGTADAAERAETGHGPMTVTAGGNVGALMRAMSGGVESNGDPNATNARTGAHGAWQIMPKNWKPWATAAGVDPADQSLANQARVVEHVMNGYLADLGSIDAVAVAWYAGPSAAKAWVKNPNAARFNKRPAPNEPSVNEYVARIRAAMGAR